MKEFILNENELELLIKNLKSVGIYLLCGTLASGKTSLVKAWLKYLGYENLINSPTFSIMQTYELNSKKIYHYDIYQQGFDGLLKNGLVENFFEDGLHLVEWGDEKLLKYLKKFNLNVKKIEISHLKNKRKYEIYE